MEETPLEDLCVDGNIIFNGCERNRIKVKGKGRLWVLQHCCLEAYCTPSFISRGAAHTKRRERPLLAKEGTIPGI